MLLLHYIHHWWTLGELHPSDIFAASEATTLSSPRALNVVDEEGIEPPKPEKAPVLQTGVTNQQ